MSTALPMVAPGVSGLDTSVLVLNRLFMAVRVVRARHAFVMLWKHVAEVVSVEDETYACYDFSSWTEVSAYRKQFQPALHDWIHTVRFELAVPRVIRLLRYDRLPKTRVRLNRRNLFTRDGNRCQYCGKKFKTPELSIDHVVPRSRGGRTPAEAGLALVREPVQPRFSPAITLHAGNEKYRSWKQFLDTAYWHVELRD